MEEISQLVSADFNGPLVIYKGLSDSHINQLIHFANTDETVKKFTSDARRFADREAFDKWRKPSTCFYTLSDRQDHLLGIIWLEELELPEFNPVNSGLPPNLDLKEYTTTYAIRLYGQARGKGLSTPFTDAVLKDFCIGSDSELSKKIWLATSPDNSPAIKSYQKAGFVPVGMRKDGLKLIMILV